MALYLTLLLRFLAVELPVAIPFVLLPMLISKLRRGISIVTADVYFIFILFSIVLLSIESWIVSIHYFGYLVIFLMLKVHRLEMNIWIFRFFILFVLWYSGSMILDRSIYINRSINYLLLTRLHLFALVLLSVNVRKRPIANVVISAIILLSLFLTHARTNAFLGLGIFLFGIIRSIEIRKDWFKLFFVLAGLSYLMIENLSRLYELKAIERIVTDSTSGAMRYNLWRVALSDIDLVSFLVGNGAGASSKLAQLYGMPYLHNIFLEWIYDFGIFGALLCIFFLVTMIKSLITIWFANRLKVIIAMMFLVELIQFLKSFDGLQLWSLIILTSLVWRE